MAASHVHWTRLAAVELGGLETPDPYTAGEAGRHSRESASARFRRSGAYECRETVTDVRERHS